MSTATTVPVSDLFLTSRTARDTWFFCPRARYLGNHWGPHGYGIQPLRQNIPQATGARVHTIFEPVLTWVKDHDALPPDAIVNAAAVAALDAYRADVRDRGLTYWNKGEAAYLQMVQEQEYLIVGLPMLWITHQLPLLLKDWRICYVEDSGVSVYRCTCGLGDGIQPADAHVSRGCQGIGLQTRGDFVAQHRTSLSYSYHEFKTRGGDLTDSWAESFETRVQMTLGTLGVEQKYGLTIDQVFLHGLSKGKYGRNKELGEYQDSRLCWAWRKPAAPPVSDEEWGYEYEWWEEQPDGSVQKRRLGKGYQRTWVGKFPGGLPAWIATLPERVVAKVLRVIPILRNPMAKAAALESWIALEAAIQDNLYGLHDLLQGVRFDWAHPQIQSYLNVHFPQSWDCQRFGKRYACAFKPICHRDPGWQDPYGLGFVDRRPHHGAELDQAVGRGLIPAAETWDGDEE